MLLAELVDTAILASWARMDDSSLSVEEFLSVPYGLRTELLSANPGGEEIAVGLRAMLDDMPSKTMFTNDTLQPYGYFGAITLGSDIFEKDDELFDCYFTRNNTSAYQQTINHLTSSKSFSVVHGVGVGQLMWAVVSQAAMPFRLDQMAPRSKEIPRFKSSSLILRHILTSSSQAGYISEETLVRFEKVAAKTAKELIQVHKNGRIVS